MSLAFLSPQSCPWRVKLAMRKILYIMHFYRKNSIKLNTSKFIIAMQKYELPAVQGCSWYLWKHLNQTSEPAHSLKSGRPDFGGVQSKQICGPCYCPGYLRNEATGGLIHQLEKINKKYICGNTTINLGTYTL